MPPHLHRRPPLRQPIAPRRRLLDYHHTTRKPVADPRARRAHQHTLDLPIPEDRSAIQQAIGQVLQAIASNTIDPRRAGLLLYGLQIASSNLPRQNPKATPAPQVEETTLHPEAGLIAPPTEWDEDIALGRPKSIMRKLLDELEAEKHQNPDEHTIPTSKPPKKHPRPPAKTPVAKRKGTGSNLPVPR